MDLNFVDPPVPANAQVVELSVTDANVADELEQVAVWLETGEEPRKAFMDEPLEGFARALREPRAADDYVAALPMVARFLTIEMDPAIEGEDGIGRMQKPPRFAGHYRKQLADAVTHERASRMAEQLIFRGYAAMTAIATVRNDPFDLLDRPLSDRWGAFIRSISAAYLALLGNVDLKKQPIEAYLLFLARKRIEEYAQLASDLKLARGLSPFSKSRANAYGPFFVGVGVAVWAPNTSTTVSLGELV